MYRLCPRLQKFWSDVFRTLTNDLKKNLDPDPLLALLGVTDRDHLHLTFAKHCVIAFALLLAKRAVLLKWKDAARPRLISGFDR